MHAPQKPGRKEGLERMLPHLKTRPVFIEDRPAPCWQWSERVWMKALEHDVTHYLFLNDDLILCPDFENVVQAAIDAKPMVPICLQTNHWRFEDLWKAGHAWGCSFEGLVGPAYILPKWHLLELLAFRGTKMKPEAILRYPEDALINLYCMANSITVYHCMPSPVDHDTEIPSTWNADHHLYRHPTVPWQPVPGGDLRKFWSEGSLGVAGLIYEREHWRLRSHLTADAVKQLRVLEKMYFLGSQEQPRIRPAVSG